MYQSGYFEHMTKRTLKISAKCSDMFHASLIDESGNPGTVHEYDGYVPDWFPNPTTQHWGDYVELTIDLDTGKIIGWKPPTKSQLDESFQR
jgi:hypothetical protein